MSQIDLAEAEASLQILDDALLLDTRFQIAGLCVILDFSNAKKDNIMKMFEPKMFKTTLKYYQVNIILLQ